jgi:hypothetical protein
MAYTKRGPFANVPPGTTPPAGAVPANANTYNHFDDALDDQDGRITTLEGAGGGGVTDHGALTGLSDDDHPQYHNNTRGDARYALTGHNHDATYVNESDHTKAAHESLGMVSAKQILLLWREGPLVVGNGPGIPTPFPFTITDIESSLDVAGSTSNVVLHVWQDGVNVQTITFAPGETTDSLTGLNIVFARGEKYALRIENVDSGATAVGVSVALGVVD